MKRWCMWIVCVLVSVMAFLTPLSMANSGGGSGSETPCHELDEAGLKHDAEGKCRCGTKLLTKMPLVGDCISKGSNVFASLIGQLSRIVLSLIFVAAVIVVIVGGVMMTASGANESWFKEGRSMIFKVAIGIVVLGLGGIILRIVNPNFFGPKDPGVPTSSGVQSSSIG